MSSNPILSFTIRYGKPFTTEPFISVKDQWNRKNIHDRYGLIIGIPGHNEDYYVLSEIIRSEDINYIIKCADFLGANIREIKYENIPKNNS